MVSIRIACCQFWSSMLLFNRPCEQLVGNFMLVPAFFLVSNIEASRLGRCFSRPLLSGSGKFNNARKTRLHRKLVQTRRSLKPLSG